MYRSVNSYRHLVDKTVEGNPEALSTQEVADGSRPALDDFHAEQLAAVRDTFNVRTEQGRTQTDVADVATAATYGQVDTVFIDIDSVVPGSLDPQTGALTTGESTNGSTYGVVDEIARRALLTSVRGCSLFARRTFRAAAQLPRFCASPRKQTGRVCAS